LTVVAAAKMSIIKIAIARNRFISISSESLTPLVLRLSSSSELEQTSVVRSPRRVQFQDKDC
jgi:hypothetical protein